LKIRRPPVIDLAMAPGAGEAWDRPRSIIYLWGLCELLFVSNPAQVSSAIRIGVLRAFGARIGPGVIFRPRTRVKFPWKLSIGENSWIGEGVWFHNQDQITVGSNVVISQESFLTTGSHAHRKDMALVTRPIDVGEGTWITSRCIILGGSSLGISCLVGPGAVVSGAIPDNSIVGPSPSTVIGQRFPVGESKVPLD